MHFKLRLMWYIRLRYRVGLFCPTREIFIHMETSPLPIKGCLCSALLAIEQLCFFSTCHTYYYTEYAFILVIFEDQWLSQLLSSVISGAVTTCFYDFGQLRLGFEHPTFRMRENALTDCATAAVTVLRYWNIENIINNYFE